MNIKTRIYKTPLDSIETTIGGQLSPQSIELLIQSESKIQDLAFAYDDYYHHFKMPKKTANQLRPYIYPHLEEAWNKVGGNYMNDILPILGEMTSNIKRYLLYANGLCIEDPMCYILDFFHWKVEIGEIARSHFVHLKNLLSEYHQLSELIRNNILILASASRSDLAKSLTQVDPHSDNGVNSKLRDLEFHQSYIAYMRTDST